jgi:hypothetical protein
VEALKSDYSTANAEETTICLLRYAKFIRCSWGR